MPEPVREPGWETNSRMRDEALRLQAKGTERGLTLRITGSLAVELHCPAHPELLARLGRRPVRDIDFMAYAREQRGIEAMFLEEGWLEDPVITAAKEYGIKRLIYTHPTSRHKVDVFLDQLVMSHTIDMRGRLELDAPAITLVDLLLSKLQIHEITDNDLLDLIVLFTEHDLGDGRAGTIDLPYLLGITSRDWGFDRTASVNLVRLLETAGRAQGLPPDTATLVRDRIAALRARMEAEPKSPRWRLRAAVGTRAPWYQDVDEVERGA